MENKRYNLSKDAIKYLDSIKIENNRHSIDIKSIKIKTNLTLQIEKAEKINNCIFSSTLIDNSFKSDRFKLIFDKENEIPKKGDIINIKEIEKCFNEESNIFIYECKEIIFIAKEKNFILDISKIPYIDKIIKNNQEENNLNKINIKNIEDSILEEEEEEKEEEEDDDHEFNQDKKEKFYNKININDNEEKKIYENKIINNDRINAQYKKDNNQNFLTVSNLEYNSRNFNIYLKCLKKYEIKGFRFKKDKKYQNYMFLDCNNEKIEGISFDEMSDKLDKIIKLNDIYQINNCFLIQNNINYCKTKCPYKLYLTKTIEIFNISNNKKIKNLFVDKFEEAIKKNENDDSFLNISKIVNKKKFDIINIFCFVLKDYGTFTFYNKYKNEYYGRRLCLGDDSNYKVNITFWHPNDLKKVYNEGELLYIKNIKVMEFNENIILYATKYTIMKNGYNSEFDDKLKKYYSEHNKINEYYELKIDIKKNSNFINKMVYKQNNNLLFIKDILSTLNNNINKEEIRFKINARFKAINHSHKNYYYGCCNCKKKMLNDMCKNCGGKMKIIIMHYSVKVMDCSSTFWILFFGNLAESFLGIKGEEYKNIIDKGINSFNKELTLLNKKLENQEFIFIGKSQ